MEEEGNVITDAVKLEKAKEFKAQGNEAYKNKNYRQAIGKYHRALLHLKGVGQNRESLASMFVGHDEDVTHPIPPEMLEDVGITQADCYNNLAACLLQQEDSNYMRIVEYCDNVLAVRPGNVKAIFRKGQALYNLKNYDTALDVFSQADGDPSVKKYSVLCKQEIGKQEKQLKAAYKGMFDKLSNKSEQKMNTDNT